MAPTSFKAAKKASEKMTRTFEDQTEERDLRLFRAPHNPAVLPRPVVVDAHNRMTSDGCLPEGRARFGRYLNKMSDATSRLIAVSITSLSHSSFPPAPLFAVAFQRERTRESLLSYRKHHVLSFAKCANGLQYPRAADIDR